MAKAKMAKKKRVLSEDIWMFEMGEISVCSKGERKKFGNLPKVYL